MKQKDRRIRRTRRLLNKALVRLIAEKEYDEITIHEITELADVGHRTFYRHYSGKDELLIDVMKTMLSGFRDLVILPSSFLNADESERTHQENGRKLFAYVGEQEAIFRVLFQGRPIVYQSMLELTRQNTSDMLNSLMDEKDSPIPYRILANHLTTSLIELMKWWLVAGKPYSADEMGRYLYQMVFKPTRDLLIDKR